MPKGAPHPEAAQDLVNFLIGVTAQEAFARHVFFAPINRATRLDPAVAAKVPYGQEQIGRMIKLDFEAMNDNVAALDRALQQGNRAPVAAWPRSSSRTSRSPTAAGRR